MKGRHKNKNYSRTWDKMVIWNLNRLKSCFTRKLGYINKQSELLGLKYSIITIEIPIFQKHLYNKILDPERTL